MSAVVYSPRAHRVPVIFFAPPPAVGNGACQWTFLLPAVVLDAIAVLLQEVALLVATGDHTLLLLKSRQVIVLQQRGGCGMATSAVYLLLLTLHRSRFVRFLFLLLIDEQNIPSW
eukprot:768540-Hanusia_phi.AAC.8